MSTRPTTAVLLAAGAATRLRPLTNELPKCLLPVADRSILERALILLAAGGITELVVVTGFCAEKLHAAVPAWWRGKITWINNDAWATTNNSVSLLMAREAVVGRPFLLMDSDIIFTEPVLTRLLASPHGDALALREGQMGVEEIKVELAADGRVIDIGKHIDPAKAVGESIGIERFSVEGGAEMFRYLDGRVRGQGLVNEWYEASWQEAVRAGWQLRAVSTGGAYCAEIDTAEDLAEVARRLQAIES